MSTKSKPKKEKVSTVGTKPRGRPKAIPPIGPTKPKRPESAYLLFVRHQRETNPEYKKFARAPIDQAKRAAAEWKTLSETDRKPWNDKAEVKKKEYGELKQVYNKEKRPKKPLSAFMLYSQEKRSSHTGPVAEVAKKIGEEWKKLSDSEKEAYASKAKAAMDAWKLQSQEWQNSWQKKAVA